MRKAKAMCPLSTFLITKERDATPIMSRNPGKSANRRITPQQIVDTKESLNVAIAESLGTLRMIVGWKRREKKEIETEISLWNKKEQTWLTTEIEWT
jgi:hypothetical protein